MKKIKETVIFKELWDRPSKKGNPTKDSIVITIAIYPETHENDIRTAGYAIKLPGDPPVPKIGRGIARHSDYHYLFDVDIDNPEKHVYNYLHLVNKSYPKQIMDRIRSIAKIPVIGTRQYEKKYCPPERFINNIEE